jgi:succinoglycan biosynthesis protein ExoO
MEDYGLVSIIMPAYNAARYIADAIKSVLSQTYPNFEFIIVNDGSKDRTLEIAKSFKDERIKVIDLKENRGVSYARNVALDVAKGKWIAFIDADDVWRCERLEYLLGIISKYQYGKYFIADDVIISLDKQGKIVPYDSVIKTKAPKLYGKLTEKNGIMDIDMNGFLSLQFALHPIAPASKIKQQKMKFPVHLDYAEDAFFYLWLYNAGLTLLIEKEPFYYHRLTKGSLSDWNDDSIFERYRKFEREVLNEKSFSPESRKMLEKYFLLKEQELKQAKFNRALRRFHINRAFKMFSEHPHLVIKAFGKAVLFLPQKAVNYIRVKQVLRRNGSTRQ